MALISPSGRGSFIFFLANRRIILYDMAVARDREVPRREFLWPGESGFKRRANGRRSEYFHGKSRMANPFEFMQQVRSEASKVIWPTRRETLITTGMVLLMVVFASLFFVTVDEALRLAVGLVLGIGRHG
jgi:preprotein translocase subunit SecE